LDDAIAQFEAALRQRPNSAAVHLDLAVALLQVPGRSGEAVPHLEEALRLQPSLGQARRLLDLVRKSSR
jgi:predicted Zn-dependent protease